MRIFFLMRRLIVCLSLASAVAFFSYQTHQVWFAATPMEASPPTQTGPSLRADSLVSQRRSPPFQVYESIAQRNLFSPDRMEEPPKAVPVVQPSVPARPLDSRFALFGIVMDGRERKALVSNLEKMSAGEKDHIWLTVGGRTGPLAISEIQPERITVTDGANVYVVRVTDKNYQKQGAAARYVRQQGSAHTIQIGKTNKKPTSDMTTQEPSAEGDTPAK